MESINRRGFLKRSAVGAAGMIVGSSIAEKDFANDILNNTINIGEAGTLKEDTMSNQNPWEEFSKVVAHPRLFFKKSDLSDLKQKAKSPPCKVLWEQILRRSKNSNDVLSLSLAYLMTDNVSFADRAKASIWKALDTPKWDEPQFLSVNPRLMSAAIGYDLLYDYLTQAERAQIRQVTMKNGIELVYNAARQHPWWSDWPRCNWGLVIFGAAGVASVAFLGEEERTPEYVQFFSDKLQFWLMEGGEEGGWGESVSYYNYAWFNGIQFIDAMKHASNGKVDFFKHPFLSKTFSYPLYLTMPDDSDFVNFSNLSGGIGSTNHIMRKFAAEFKNPYAQWQANKREGSSPFEFIWYDPHLEPKAPTDLPKARLFKTIHWAVMRTGWTDANDILFAMKGGHNDWDHHHLDHNTFILNGYGERLIIDHGYAWATPPDRIPYANDTKAHNTLLVNGNGQLDGATNYAGGRGAWHHFTPLSDFVHSERYDGLTGDAKGAYAPDELREYIRQVMFMRPDYFVIFDTVEADKPSTFEWLFHTFGSINVEGNCVMITQGDASLAIKVLKPEPFAYEFAEHSMEGSRNRFIRKNTDRYIKLRPREKCLHANLMGILYPARTADEKATMDFLTKIQKIEGNNCVGASIQCGKASDIVLFDGKIDERREPRTISADGISTDGCRCMVRKGSKGEVVAFAVHRGKKLDADNITLISALQLITAAFSLEANGMQGSINLVAASTVQVRLFKKPKEVYAGNKTIDFSFDDEKNLLTFALSFGDHQILIK